LFFFFLFFWWLGVWGKKNKKEGSSIKILDPLEWWRRRLWGLRDRGDGRGQMGERGGEIGERGRGQGVEGVEGGGREGG